MSTVAQRIAEKYPFLAFLANDREMGPLLAKAVDVNQPYSGERFQADMMKTQWWRRQSDSMRQWASLVNANPGEANQRRAILRQGIFERAFRFGTQLNSNQVRWFTELALQKGITDPNDPVIMNWIRSLPGSGKIGGDVGAAKQQYQALARGQWYVRPDDRTTSIHARRIAGGLDTLESANSRFAKQAMTRYPWLKDRIAAGETLADITQNHRQIVAEELEFDSPEAVDVRVNPEWRQLLGIRDKKSGKMRQMTDTEVIALARNRNAWWQTSRGRQTDATLASQMLQLFGQRA